MSATDPAFTPRSLPPEVAAIRFGDGRYEVLFASDAEQLDAALRLRFEVFNLELGEGLESSHETGRDCDEFDPHCDHLLVVTADSGTVVGTYRMQTKAMADAGAGFYTSGEFDLGALPAPVLDSAVEIGRACIAREHRNRKVLFLLWKGMARYIVANRLRYLFGCCSLTSQDPCDGRRMLAYLEEHGHLHPDYRVPPQPGLECTCERVEPADVVVPDLFRTYLRFGARICGEPAIDREFKTIDFLALFDVEAMDPRSRRLFFES